MIGSNIFLRHPQTLMADMADATSHSELIAQFTSVTGVDAERAKFFLESAAWKLDVSIYFRLIHRYYIKIYRVV